MRNAVVAPLGAAVALSVLWLGNAWAAAPVLFFSDLEWGPKTGWENSSTKGAAVTVWGENFGPASATSKLTVAGRDIASTNSTFIAEWNAADPARGLRRITFWLDPACSDGAGTVSVTTAGGTSKTLPFSVQAAPIYYVDVGQGSNTNDGRTTAAAFKDLYMFSNQHSSLGDAAYIYYVRGGTYRTVDTNGPGFVRMNGPLGADGTKRKALVGYPGETPILDGNNAVVWVPNYPPYGRVDHLTVAKLTVQNGSTSITAVGNGWRVVGNTFQNQTIGVWAGVVGADNAHDFYVYGNYFYHCGYDSYMHNIYLKSNPPDFTGQAELETANNEVAWNEIDSAVASDAHGGAIFISTASNASSHTKNVYVHDNFLHDLETQAVWVGDGTAQEEIYLYNNVIQSIHSDNFIDISNCLSCYLYNNTFASGTASEYMVDNEWTAQGNNHLVSMNNIFYSTTGAAFFLNGGSPTTSEHDLFFGAAVPSGAVTVTSSSTADPRFVGYRTGTGRSTDYHLQPGSPAASAGTSAVSALVRTDYDGVPRPTSGQSCAVGAFEKSGARWPRTATRLPRAGRW